MKSAHPSARAGFTLIELLMVILIIGLLSGLLLVAVNAGLRKAQEAAVFTEIQQLSMAIESFKNDKGVYPLSFGFRLGDDPSSDKNNANARRVERAFAKIFPRYTGNFASYAEDLKDGAAYTQVAPYTIPLLIEKLDPAESLVFWLGGLPDPSSETKLLGFRNDPAQPFKYMDTSKPIDDPVNITRKDQNRKQAPYFQFDPARLVDRDSDGWLEYVPKGSAASGVEMPPYVYFDGVSYGDLPAYPDPTEFDTTGSKLWQSPGVGSDVLAVWGTVIPYAKDESAKSGAKVQWMSSQKYQIITAGRDGVYGLKLDSGLFSNNTKNPAATLTNQLRLLPSCTRYLNITDPLEQTQFDQQLDNQTNFTEGKVGDNRP